MNNEPKQMSKNSEILACILYSEYCKSVGGVAFNNSPLPKWEEFYKDPAKQKQVQAWVAVAEKAMEISGIRIIV